MNDSSSKLENGSKLRIFKIPSVQTVTISAFIKAGFKYDPQNKPGLAHFVEHMLFYGTKSFPNSKELSLAIERYGGWQYAFTWVEHQQHTIHLPKEHYELGIKIIVEKITNPIFNDTDIEREKQMVKEEILRNRSDPEKAILDYVWQPLFFEGTHLARPYSGVEKDIDNIERNDVYRFIDQTYLPSSTAFIVSGNVNENDILETFKKSIKNYQRDNKVIRSKLEFKGKARIKILPAQVEQTSVVIGIKTVEFINRDKYALDLLKDILGGFLGAKLPQKLREKGLIYNWNIWQDNFPETGYILFRTSTVKKNAYKLIEIILQELEALASKSLDEEELDTAKGHLIGDLYCNKQTGMDFNEWFGIQELLGKTTLTIEEQANIYRRITLNNLARICQEYLKRENIYIAVLGDLTQDKLVDIANR